MNRTNDVVLTGLPRSGTTLTCYLLNKLPNTVALHEPVMPKLYDHESKYPMLDRIERFYKETRRMALDEGEVFSKHVGGEVPDNPFSQRRSGYGLRSSIVEETGRIPVGEELGDDFLLVVKRPAMFTALLPALAERFSAYAVIRNPLAVLASWNSIDTNIQRGHSPAAERFDEDLRRELASTEDRIERQLRLLSWWYERFRQALPEGSIIRYEEIVASGGRALCVITPAAQALDEPLSSQNLNASYGQRKMRSLGKRLLEREGAYWQFYSRESVEELLEEIAPVGKTWLKRTLALLPRRGEGSRG